MCINSAHRFSSKILIGREYLSLVEDYSVSGSVFSSFFFFRKNYLLSCETSVRPSVEIISFRGNSLSNRPIELKIGMNVREGVVHVRKV